MSRVEVEGRRFSADLVSQIRLSAGGLPGSTLDPVADLGFPDEKGIDYRVSIRILRRLKLRGGYLKMNYEGEAAPSSPVSVAGLPVAAGQTLSSTATLKNTRGGAEFDLFRGVYGYLAVVGELARFEAAAGFEAGSASASDLQRMDLPLLGLKARLYLTPAMAVSVEGLGMKRESTGVMTEIDAAVTYNMHPSFAITYGYRNSYNRFKELEGAGDRSVYRLRGQFVGVVVRF
jgi:hypothetical protein